MGAWEFPDLKPLCCLAVRAAEDPSVVDQDVQAQALCQEGLDKAPDRSVPCHTRVMDVVTQRELFMMKKDILGDPEIAHPKELRSSCKNSTEALETAFFKSATVLHHKAHR